MSSTMVTIYSSGDFYDETASSTSSLLVKAGVVINSRGGDLYCWNADGSLSSYVLSVVINNSNNYDYPLAGYQVYKYDANGNETLLTTEGAYESTSKDFILAVGESYKIISLDRAEGTEITKQSGTNYTFTSGETYLIQSDTEVTIYPGEGILIRCSVSNGSGSGGASHKIYEKTNGDYYQIASFDGPTTYIDVAVKKGATIKYWVKLGSQNFIQYSTGDHYLFDGIVTKTSALSTDAVSDGTKLTTGSESSGKYSEVSNIQSSCTIHQLIIKNNGCLTGDTLILMADYTYKQLRDLKIGDEVICFNHETGELIKNTIMANTHLGSSAKEWNVIELKFDNGETLEVVMEHGIFDLTLNEYIMINENTYQDYIGHEFAYLNTSTNELEPVRLISSKIVVKVTDVYSPDTFYHLNHIANNFLAFPGDLPGFYNQFTFDENLKYDNELMQQDIEKYGLLSYEELCLEVELPYEVYEAFPLKYYKIAIAKGLTTYDELRRIVDLYLEEFLENYQ